MRAELIFGQDGFIKNLRGWFEVQVRDVTLGEPELDDSVRNSVEFLQSADFPVSRFDIKNAVSADKKLQPDRKSTLTLEGQFLLKGVTIPLTAHVTIEPSQDANRWRLRFQATFMLEQLRETFKISGPGGEYEPSGNRMLFDVQCAFVPASN